LVVLIYVHIFKSSYFSGIEAENMLFWLLKSEGVGVICFIMFAVSSNLLLMHSKTTKQNEQNKIDFVLQIV